MVRVLVRGLILSLLVVAALALAWLFAVNDILPAVNPLVTAAGCFVVLMLIWYLAMIAVRWKQAAKPPHATGRSHRVARIAVHIPVLLIAIAILAVTRSVAVEPVSPAGRSMEPTISNGDYLLVSKFAYGYSRYSFPFEIVPISGRVMEFEARRGDIVAYRDPRNVNEIAVSRVIGIPRDRVRMVKGQTYINGEAIKREPLDDVTMVIASKPMQVRQWRETLFDGSSFRTLDLMDDGPFDDVPEQNVPPGRYFVISDNRDSSADSRYQAIGPIPHENLVGRILFCLRSPCGR
jgi:signal peptidase I